jgi:hypothetical protein
LRWTRVHGIPTQSFVRIWRDGLRRGRGSAAQPQDWVFHKSRKPVYLDLASWYLVAALQRMLDGPASVAVFEEALPAPEAARQPPDDPAVSEFLGVKTGQLGGGRAKLCGTIDIVTLQTLARQDDVVALTTRYGLIIADECHHVPAAASSTRSSRSRRAAGSG